jgi:hypothetical protein
LPGILSGLSQRPVISSPVAVGNADRHALLPQSTLEAEVSGLYLLHVTGAPMGQVLSRMGSYGETTIIPSEHVNRARKRIPHPEQRHEA